MTVKYVLVERGNPGDPQAPKKFYPQAKSSGKLTLQQLAERIAAISTVSSVDIVAVLEALLTVIPQELADGNIVQLGDFGSFSLRVRGEGAERAEEFRAQNITKVLPTFRPGKRFKETVRNVTFEKES